MRWRSLAAAMAPSMSSRRTSPPPSPAGRFSIGIIADVQWADAPDGQNYAKTVRRHYRGALTTLGDAVDWWLGFPEPDKPSFVAQLGDLVDGMNKRLGRSDEALRAALDQLDRMPCPSVNLIGNHELYNFDRRQLAEAPWLRHGDKEYYSFSPAVGWRVFVLDSYQISLIGLDEDDPRRREAVEILAKQNPNVSPDGKDGDWLEGMEDAGHRRRFVPYNGGFGRDQLDWFRSELEAAADAGERALIMSHSIVHPEACGGTTMAWDYDEALEIIRSKKAAGCAAVMLYGHNHKGGYHRDEIGIHHCTFISPLNKGSEGKAFGLMKFEPGYLEILAPKMDDFLPDVKGRPSLTTIENDLTNGPCESVKLLLSDLDTLMVGNRIK